jgi:RNA polymerase sigma-70 factor (ECF subfamily)
MDTMTPREDRFRTLFAAHHGAVLAFARRRSNPAHADDIAAETFLVAWRRLDDVPTRPGEALPWLYAVARHTLLNAARSDRRREALAVRIGEQQPTTDSLDTDGIARRADLATAWTRLSDTDQEVLALALWEDLPSPQAARVLGISPTAYRLRLSRARRALRRLLDPTPAPEEPTVRAVPSLQENSR